MSTDLLLERAKALKLYGLMAHWEDIHETHWIDQLLTWEEEERSRRSLERRLRSAHIGRFKSLSAFDWSWPTRCDREAIHECMQLAFIKESTHIILCGPNGVGKSTIARNIAQQAVLHGQTVLFVTAGQITMTWRRRMAIMPYVDASNITYNHSSW